MEGPGSATPPGEPGPAPGETATRRQIRGSSLLLGRAVRCRSAVNFVVQILIVRYLTKADYGAFAYALSLVSFGASLATFGLDRSVTRFVPIYDEQGEYKKLFGTLVLAIGTVTSLGLLTLVLVYSLQGVLAGSLVSDDRAISLLLILVVLSPLQALDGLLMGMFAVFSRPRAIFFRKYVLTPGLRLTVVLLLVLGGQSVFFLAAGYVATAAFGVALYGVMLHRMLREEGLLDHLREGGIQIPAREVLGFTIPLLTSDLVYMTMNTSDVILLGHFGGATDVAAFRVIGPTAHLNLLVMTSFTPALHAPGSPHVRPPRPGGHQPAVLADGHLDRRPLLPPLRPHVLARRPVDRDALRRALRGLGRLPQPPRARLLLQRGTRLQRPDAQGLRTPPLHRHDQHPRRAREHRGQHHPHPSLRAPGSGDRDAAGRSSRTTSSSRPGFASSASASSGATTSASTSPLWWRAARSSPSSWHSPRQRSSRSPSRHSPRSSSSR